MISQPCTVQRSTSSCHKLSARSSSYPQSPTCFCLKSIVSTAHVGFLVTRAHADGCQISAIAMMWTINSRKNIRLINASGKTSSSDGVSNPLSRAVGRTGEVELSRIQVHKQTETVSHVEVRAISRFSGYLLIHQSCSGRVRAILTISRTLTAITAARSPRLRFRRQSRPLIVGITESFEICSLASI